MFLFYVTFKTHDLPETPQAYKETSLNYNILILIFKLLKLLPLSTSILRQLKSVFCEF